MSTDKDAINRRIAVEVMGYQDIEVIWPHMKGLYWFIGYRDWSEEQKAKWSKTSDAECPGRSVLYERQDTFFTPSTDLNHAKLAWDKLTRDQKADASVIGAKQSGGHFYGEIFDYWLDNPADWCEAMLAAGGDNDKT